jgi:hypothetical protein
MRRLLGDVWSSVHLVTCELTSGLNLLRCLTKPSPKHTFSLLRVLADVLATCYIDEAIDT